MTFAAPDPRAGAGGPGAGVGQGGTGRPGGAPLEPDDALGAQLLAAATAEFAERGYAGARVAEIARRAGVTTGAIYSRYKGKAELLSEAIGAAMSDELDALFADHRFQGRMEDILLVAGSHLVDRSDSATPGMLLESFAAARHEPAVATLLRERLLDRHHRFIDIIDAAKAGGGIDDELDTLSVVTLCHAIGLGFLLLEVLDSPLPAPEQWERLIARLLAAAGGGEGAGVPAVGPRAAGDVA